MRLEDERRASERAQNRGLGEESGSWRSFLPRMGYAFGSSSLNEVNYLLKDGRRLVRVPLEALMPESRKEGLTAQPIAEMAFGSPLPRMTRSPDPGTFRNE